VVESLANRRKAAGPSLQHEPNTFGTKLYLREGLHSPVSPKSLPLFSLALDLPTTPKDRLDALLSPQSSSPGESVGNTPARTPEAVARHPTSHGPARNPSFPAPTSPPIHSAAAGALLRQDAGQMARNSSIDSSVSSISSNASQPLRFAPSPAGIARGARARTPEVPAESLADPAAFVTQAGSVEAALQQLWKEKQNTASHNSQLWRLVEKQRSMILGLQKDLEKALKDKERYRKKLKEQLALASAPAAQEQTLLSSAVSTLRSKEVEAQPSAPAPPAPSPAPPAPTRAAEPVHHVTQNAHESPTPVVPLSSPSHNSSASTLHLPRQSPDDDDDSSNTKTIDNRNTIILAKSASAESQPQKVPARDAVRKFHSPTDHPSPLESSSDHTSANASPITSASPHPDDLRERMQTPLTEPQTTDGSPDLEHASPRKPKPSNVSIVNPILSPPPLLTPPNPPALSITNPTPVLDSGSFPSPPKVTLATRKAAPAPLNLAQSNLSPQQEQSFSTNQSPIVAVRGPEGLTAEDIRGRRRTREEDDHAREIIALREEEARSASKKQSKSKSKSKSAGSTPVLSRTNSSAPQIVEHSADMVAVPNRSPMDQLRPGHMSSALLSPSNSESSMNSAVQRSSFAAPLLSPGLPVSPRPGDRPPNSPAPRQTKMVLGPSPPSLSPFPSAPQAGPRTKGSPTKPDGEAASTPIRVSAFPAPLFASKAESSASPTSRSRDEQSARSTPVLDTADPAVNRAAQMSDPAISKANEAPEDKIFRGFVSEQYPGLLLPPNALPLIDLKVFSSRLRPSRNSIMLSKDEDPVFLLGIYSRSSRKQLWRLEKTSYALSGLHNQIRSLCSFDGKLPDSSLFKGHSPAKIDARRAALNAYFNSLLESPLSEDGGMVVCNFFSTDVMEAEADNLGARASPSSQSARVAQKPTHPQREGYLGKRGKKFGGWKAHFFVLDGPELKYYDAQGGPQVGAIRLNSAQIGKQSNNQPNASDEDNQYRHAFLILEPKKKDSSSLVRHVLCAESDEERDAWVEACLAYVDFPDEKKSPSPVKQSAASAVDNAHPPAYAPPAPPNRLQRDMSNDKDRSAIPRSAGRDYGEPVMPKRKSESPMAHNQGRNHPQFGDELQTLGVSYEQTVQAEAPIIGQTSYHSRGSPASNSSSSTPKAQKDFVISGPKNGAPIGNNDNGLWGLKTPLKEKKRSIFGFRGRSSSDLNMPPQKEPTPPVENRTPPKNVFGIPLAEAVECTQPMGVDCLLPAVVYRCIEYLRAQGAVAEEGLFRLSGSSVTIKALRERFITEGDVHLLDGDYYDIHAVASLLKLYLRELPTSILSRELHLDFLKINDMGDNKRKVAIANVLVHKLPEPNYALLDALCSFLIDVVDNSGRNKMNVRNGESHVRLQENTNSY
jgi:RalA-binding protein 1